MPGPELRARITADSTQFRAEMSRVTNVTNATAAALRTSLRATGFAVGSFLTGISAKMLIKPSMDMQYWKQQMGILLKDAEATNKRMNELYQFSLRTPYTMPQVVQANRILETLTKGALSTGKAFEMVANAAAMAGTQGAQTGEDFANVAVWMGRLYTGLTKGVPVGEAMMRLQELGILSSDVRYKLEALQKSGQKGAHVWQVFAEDLKRFDGAMERLNRTMTGRVSNLADAWWAVRREVGDEVLPELLKMLNELLKSIDELRASGKLKEWGKDVARTLNELYSATKVLISFLQKNHEILKTLGMGYVGFRVLSGLAGIVMNATRAVQNFGAAWAVAGGQAAGAAAKMATAGGIPVSIVGGEQARQAAARANILSGLAFAPGMTKSARGFEVVSGGDRITGEWLLEMRRRQLARGIEPSIGVETFGRPGGIGFTGSIRSGTDRMYSSQQNIRDLNLRKSFGPQADLYMATAGMQQAAAATRDYAAALQAGYRPMTMWNRELGGMGHLLGGMAMGGAFTILISNWGKLADAIDDAATASARLRAMSPTGEKYSPGGMLGNIWGTLGPTKNNWLWGGLIRRMQGGSSMEYDIAPGRADEEALTAHRKNRAAQRAAQKAEAEAAAGPSKEEIARQQHQYDVQRQLVDRVREMVIKTQEGVASSAEIEFAKKYGDKTGGELLGIFGNDAETAVERFSARFAKLTDQFNLSADAAERATEASKARDEETQALQDERSAILGQLAEIEKNRAREERVAGLQRDVERAQDWADEVGRQRGPGGAARDRRRRERDAARDFRDWEHAMGLVARGLTPSRRGRQLIEEFDAVKQAAAAQNKLREQQRKDAVAAHREALAVVEQILRDRLPTAQDAR